MDRRLGRGLAALLAPEPSPTEPRSEVEVSSIRPNPFQPRREFTPPRARIFSAIVWLGVYA